MEDSIYIAGLTLLPRGILDSPPHLVKVSENGNDGLAFSLPFLARGARRDTAGLLIVLLENNQLI